jgi:hypothetical protein
VEIPDLLSPGPLVYLVMFLCAESDISDLVYLWYRLSALAPVAVLKLSYGDCTLRYW